MDEKRFVRTRALLGEESMKKIHSCCVMVVGAGAVGGYAIEALARSGVGRLIIVDFDMIDISNINRQILALDQSIGRRKVELAAERIVQINPDCEVITLDMFINRDNLDELLSYNPDYVIDAIDSISSKCYLIEELVKREIKFISSMGAARKIDPSKIKIGKLSETKNCALARFLRKRLHRKKVDISKVSCVFSTEEPCLTDMSVFDDAEVNSQKLPLGSLSTLPAIFGMMMANVVILEIA